MKGILISHICFLSLSLLLSLCCRAFEFFCYLPILSSLSLLSLAHFPPLSLFPFPFPSRSLSTEKLKSVRKQHSKRKLRFVTNSYNDFTTCSTPLLLQKRRKRNQRIPKTTTRPRTTANNNQRRRRKAEQSRRQVKKRIRATRAHRQRRPKKSNSLLLAQRKRRKKRKVQRRRRMVTIAIATPTTMTSPQPRTLHLTNLSSHNHRTNPSKRNRRNQRYPSSSYASFLFLFFYHSVRAHIFSSLFSLLPLLFAYPSVSA